MMMIIVKSAFLVVVIAFLLAGSLPGALAGAGTLCPVAVTPIRLAGQVFLATQEPVGSWNLARDICRACFFPLIDLTPAIVEAGRNLTQTFFVNSFGGGPTTPGLVWISPAGVVVPGIPGPQFALCRAEGPPPPRPPPDCGPTANFTANFARIELAGRVYFGTRTTFENWKDADAFCLACVGPLAPLGFAQITSTNGTGLEAAYFVGSYEGGPYTPGLAWLTPSGVVAPLPGFATQGGGALPALCFPPGLNPG